MLVGWFNYLVIPIPSAGPPPGLPGTEIKPGSPGLGSGASCGGARVSSCVSCFLCVSLCILCCSAMLCFLSNLANRLLAVRRLLPNPRRLGLGSSDFDRPLAARCPTFFSTWIWVCCYCVCYAGFALPYCSPLLVKRVDRSRGFTPIPVCLVRLLPLHLRVVEHQRPHYSLGILHPSVHPDAVPARRREVGHVCRPTPLW